MNRIKGFITTMALSGVLAAGAAQSKLPPPPEAAKAQAAEVSAKSAWQDKVAAYQLCLAQDRVVEAYRKGLRGAGKPAPPPASTATCADPGPFASPLAQKPLEASGAHSPPGTASTPPSQKGTAAETMGTKK